MFDFASVAFLGHHQQYCVYSSSKCSLLLPQGWSKAKRCCLGKFFSLSRRYVNDPISYKWLLLSCYSCVQNYVEWSAFPEFSNQTLDRLRKCVSLASFQNSGLKWGSWSQLLLWSEQQTAWNHVNVCFSGIWWLCHQCMTLQLSPVNAMCSGFFSSSDATAFWLWP